MSSLDPEAVRAIVRRTLEERLGAPTSATPRRVDWSHLEIGTGPECSDDLDFPIHKPCLIEPHRLCYNSGYCKKLGH